MVAVRRAILPWPSGRAKSYEDVDETATRQSPQVIAREMREGLERATERFLELLHAEKRKHDRPRKA